MGGKGERRCPKQCMHIWINNPKKKKKFYFFFQEETETEKKIWLDLHVKKKICMDILQGKPALGNNITYLFHIFKYVK
jgi:hypothetical protein